MTTCRNPGSGLSSAFSTKYPCTCQWLCLMRAFNEKHKEKCNTVEAGPATKTHEFMTGSSYEGEWQEGCGMHGYGVYTFLNGVIYEGEFFEGAFHGKGELRYQTPAGKAVIRGQWNKGVMTERTVVFDDALEHDAENWQYCKMPDRRFLREYADGVQPSGKSIMTAYQPYVDVHEGYVDTGDGFYDPLTKVIYEHDDYKKILRSPGICEQKWIRENCRIGKRDMTMGPREDLYEEFVEPTVLLEPVPPPPANFIGHTKKQSTWELKDRLFLIYIMTTCRKRTSGFSTVEAPGPATKTHEFMTGSSYEGEWQEGCGMHGYGVYTFPNGVIYEGEFFEGAFHGKGELRYQTPAGKAVIRGQWNKGVMTERTVVFDDALEHDAENWQYCKMPDRRFSREYADGVQPSGKSIMTAYQPYVEIPDGYVDTVDGFYDPLKRVIYEHDDYTKILRVVSESVRRGPARHEQKWILENCRIGKTHMTIGPRQDLYENFVKPTVLQEPVPPPPTKFIAPIRKEATWELYQQFKDAPPFYNRTNKGPPERHFKPSPIPTVPTGHE